MSDEEFSYVRVRWRHNRIALEAQARGAGLVTSHLVAAVANRSSNDIIFAIPRDGSDEWFEKRREEIASLSAQGIIVERIYSHSERPEIPRLTWRDLWGVIRYGKLLSGKVSR